MEQLEQNAWREAIQKDSNAVILDVRTDGECAEGIVEGAQIIDFLNPSHFMTEIEKLDPSKSYYIYCRSGNRSGQACMILDQKGFAKTVNLIGGMLAWNGDLVE